MRSLKGILSLAIWVAKACWSSRWACVYGASVLILLVAAGSVCWLFWDALNSGLTSEFAKRIISLLFGAALFTPLIIMVFRFISIIIHKKIEAQDSTYILMYFIPFFVLSLALLFQLDNITKNNPASMAAIAGVMILFLLSQLGVGVLQVVHKMGQQAEALKEKADQLKNHLVEADATVKGVDFLSSYLDVALPSNRDNMASSIKNLFGAWSRIANDERDMPRSPNTRMLLRTLLSRYYAEEYKDFSGKVTRSQVPEEIWPFPKDYPKDEQDKAAVFFMATNVGYYTSYLADAIKKLYGELGEDKNSGRRPCISVVSNVLPSHFYNWPFDFRGSEYWHVNETILGYYEELRMLVKDGDHGRPGGAIYRTILVSKPDDEGKKPNEPEIGRDPKSGLWRLKQWEWEKSWHLYFDRDGNRPTWSTSSSEDEDLGALSKHYIRENSRNELSGPNVEWIPPLVSEEIMEFERQRNLGRFNMVRTKRSSFLSKGCGLAMVGKKLRCINLNWSEDVSTNIPFRSVINCYEQDMHPSAGAGFTQILACDAPTYKEKFSSRPDMMFFGTCKEGYRDDIWEKQDSFDENVEWNLLIMATFSSASYSMLMTVIYEEELIRFHWKKTSNAICNLRKSEGTVVYDSRSSSKET